MSFPTTHFANLAMSKSGSSVLQFIHNTTLEERMWLNIFYSR